MPKKKWTIIESIFIVVFFFVCGKYIIQMEVNYRMPKCCTHTRTSNQIAMSRHNFESSRMYAHLFAFV